MSELFERRHLFVRHRLTADQKKTLQRITRGLAPLRRLRSIMDEVYRLFDRRCRTETVLARLARLRRRVNHFKRLGRALDKLSSPNLEKALTFLDDKLLPATSNAVERSNRRYRKAQRSIYSVRTAEHIGQRIALDMQPDQQAPDRADHEGLASGSFCDGKTPTMMLQSPVSSLFLASLCRHNQTWPRTADCHLPVKPSVRSRAAAIMGLEDRRTKMDLMEAGRILRPRP